MSIDFSNKTAIITGAASGIGFALASALGKKGMKIVMADIDTASLQQSADKLSEQGLDVLAVKLDVTEISDWQALAEKSKSHFGGAHMLINNAGVGGIPSSVEDTDTSIWQWVVDVNMTGVMLGAKTITPLIKETGEGGWIINVASMAGMHGIPYATAYSATKAAVVSMSESWAAELKPFGIHVSALCPAFVKTRIHEPLRTKQDKYETDIHTKKPESLKDGYNKAAALVESGIDADLLAARVVEALNHKQYYIFTHPNYRESVGYRGKALDLAFEDALNSPLVAHLKDDEIVSL